MQWFYDHSTLLVILQSDGLLVEKGVWVVRCVLSVSDRDAAKIFARRTVLMHIAGGKHGHPGSGSEQPEWGTPAEIHHARRSRCGMALNSGAESSFRTFVEGPIHEAVVACAARHRHRSLMQRTARRPTAMVNAAKVREFFDSEIPCYVDFVVFFNCETNDSVDLFGFQACILNGCIAAFDREPEGAAPLNF